MSDQTTLISLTADIVASHVSNNAVAAGDVAGLVTIVHDALSNLQHGALSSAVAKQPAVSVRASVKPAYLVCLECGAKFSTLKRHLRTSHNLTPEEYRRDYGLTASYPIIASDYSERRQAIAKAIGLGATAGGRPKGKGRRKV